MAEVKATVIVVPSVKFMVLLAILSSSLVQVGNGLCDDAYGCSFGEVCCDFICVKGSSCAGQFCEYYTECSSKKLICCNNVCVKRSNCVGQDCSEDSDCYVGEKCCKEKCIAGDHCSKGSKCPDMPCVFILVVVLPCTISAIFVIWYSCRKSAREASYSGDSARPTRPVVHNWFVHIQAPLPDNPDTKEGSAPPPPDHAALQGTSGGVYTPQASYGAV